MNKAICSVLLISILCTLLTGCFDRREIDDQTYIIAMGLDKGTMEPLKLTLQYALPAAIGGGGGGGAGGGSEGSKSLNSVTIDVPTLNSGINMANGFIGKKLNMSHAVVVVISKELAKEGIRKYIYGISRGREFRPSMFIAVCRDTAEDYLNSIKPVQESDPSKYYQLLFSEYRNTAFTANTSIYSFYSTMETLDDQPIAILAGLSKYKNSKDFNIKNSTALKKGRQIPFEGDFKAGEIPKIGDQKGEIMGLSIFNGDSMIGELDGAECRSYLMTKGNLNSTYITINDPEEPKSYIVLNVKQSRKPTRTVKLQDDKPKLSVKLRLEADFISIQSGINYEDPKLLSKAEEAGRKLITADVCSFLDRTIRNYHSDICGFGKEAKKNFLTYEEWKEYKWLEKYKNSTFTVNVELQIRRPGLLLRTFPPVESSEIKELQ